MSADIPGSLSEAADQLRDGSLSSVELTRAVLRRADELDESTGTYITRFDEQALIAAEQSDRERAAGTGAGYLHGIPIGVKDLLAASEGPTTAQSLVLDPAWGAGKDATVVARLRSAGAVITGKLTTMEFACGVPDPSKPYPVPRNPWRLDSWPGGSSSGAAIGVATGMFLGSIGSDTGGSIRIPAALCGVTGLMPTFGLVSKAGCVPASYSLDRVGPLARTARDCAIMMRVLAGFDPLDPTSRDCQVPDYLAALNGRLDGLRIGVEREHHFPEGSDLAAQELFDEALEVMRGLGAATVDITLPHYDASIGAARVTGGAEGMAYHRPDLLTRWDDYGPGTTWMISRGALVSGADYVQAQRVRRVVQLALHELLTEVDLVASPTATIAAIPFTADGSADFGEAFRFIFTQYWNLPGNPAISLPMGFNATGMPLSLHLAGRPFDEALLLRTADAYQRVTGWHRRMPPLVDSKTDEVVNETDETGVNS